MAEPNDGAVLPSCLQLQAGQLGRIITAGAVCLQQLHPPFHADDTPLGELQLPSYDAV